MCTALELFADLLRYPWSPPAAVASRCAALLAPAAPEAAAKLASFVRCAEEAPVERMQEIYGATFELDPRCPPYVGYHVFGETYKRSAFLVGLAARYRDLELDAGPERELADHLSLVLRFLARTPDTTERDELVADVLRPALKRMVRKSARTGGPYADVLGALELAIPGLVPVGESEPVGLPATPSDG